MLAYSAMIFLGFFFFFPMWIMIVTAFRNNDPGSTTEVQLLCEASGLLAFLPTANMGFENFRDMLRRVDYWRAFFNSGLVVSSMVIAGLVVNSSFAYALARLDFWGRNALLVTVITLIIV